MQGATIKVTRKLFLKRAKTTSFHEIYIVIHCGKIVMVAEKLRLVDLKKIRPLGQDSRSSGRETNSV